MLCTCYWNILYWAKGEVRYFVPFFWNCIIVGVHSKFVKFMSDPSVDASRACPGVTVDEADLRSKLLIGYESARPTETRIKL